MTAETSLSGPTPLTLNDTAAAAYVGVSRRFLREASLAGEVAYVPLRGRGEGARPLMRWRTSDLDAWIARSVVPATSTGAVLGTVTPAAPTKHSTAPVALHKPSKAASGGPVLSARAAIRKQPAA